jgi:hypothetical protein
MTTLLLALALFQEPVLNPNTATKAELMAVDKAVTSEVADKVIKGRPYNSYKDVREVVGDEVWLKMFNFPLPAPPQPPQSRSTEKPKDPVGQYRAALAVLKDYKKQGRTDEHPDVKQLYRVLQRMEAGMTAEQILSGMEEAPASTRPE